jgi:hypothetical protein
MYMFSTKLKLALSSLMCRPHTLALTTWKFCDITNNTESFITPCSQVSPEIPLVAKVEITSAHVILILRIINRICSNSAAHHTSTHTERRSTSHSAHARLLMTSMSTVTAHETAVAAMAAMAAHHREATMATVAPVTSHREASMAAVAAVAALPSKRSKATKQPARPRTMTSVRPAAVRHPM